MRYHALESRSREQSEFLCTACGRCQSDNLAHRLVELIILWHKCAEVEWSPPADMFLVFQWPADTCSDFEVVAAKRACEDIFAAYILPKRGCVGNALDGCRSWLVDDGAIGRLSIVL